MSVWLINHFWQLFGGVGGTAIVALIGWLLKSRFSPETPAAIDNSRRTTSPVAAGSNISQRNFSPDYNFTLPFLPSGAPGRERYDEWRELSHELHEALNQIGYVFLPVNAVTPGIETNDYEVGISRGYKVIRNRLAIADTLAREKVLEKYQELVKYAVSAESPREPNQRGCPTVVGFNLKARAFEDELMEIARNDTGKIAPRPELVQRSEPPVPNLNFAGSKQKLIFIAPKARNGICDPRNAGEREKAYRALILRFENRLATDRKIGYAAHVIARLRFYSPSKATERIIDYGVWLNSQEQSTAIGVGDTAELLLFCDADDASRKVDALLTFSDRRAPLHSFYDEWSYLEEAVVDDLQMVEVTILDKSTQASCSYRFKYWRDGDSFCVQEL